MATPAVLPGVLAWASGELPAAVRTTLAGSAETDAGAARVAYWGLRPVDGSSTIVLSRVSRRATGAVPEHEVAELVAGDPGALSRLLPPFAAQGLREDGVVVVADSMGFRQLFHSDPAAGGPGVLSTSALLAGWTRGAEPDRVALAVQSLLGWQLGQRTLFEGVLKLAPGATAHLGAEGVAVTPPDREPVDPLPFERAVAEAADLLRTSLAALLDDEPDAVLQLTGGLDSRLLLSAIPASRRSGLHAMTLSVPGSGDVPIAREICASYGMVHEVHGLTDLGEIDPVEAWELCRVAALRLDGMSDPVAYAALGVAERAFDQGVRISGLGGEVARGFYYVGRVRDRKYTRADAEQLASWRMFANEAVEPGLLTEDFSAWARQAANREVYAALRRGGDEWFRATDSLYLRDRMQRWAGATDTAVGYQRVVVNPMLDHEFLRICGRLTPQDKAHARFLAALQLELDPELGKRPLEGRASPAALAHPSVWDPVAQTLRTGRRFARKALQVASRGNRPPAGGDVLAQKVVERWRADPAIVDPLRRSDFVSDEWLDGMIAATVTPRPSSVGFLTNVIVAMEGAGR
ncbi:asparagine synthase-related protein [Leifsonia sp. P73]|uniref:asparagine synthase-related protein n=1 Tax=Leifsonia sp. P73 TaxID=3423959 RepID=UPI003DA6B246